MHDEKVSIGEVINIGSGYEISVGDTVNMISEIMKKPVNIECEAERLRPALSEVERLWADNSKARRLLNWQPEYAGTEGLRRGLQKTISWFSDPALQSRYRAGRYTI